MAPDGIHADGRTVAVAYRLTHLSASRAMFEKANEPPARVTTISLPRSLVERIDDFRFERQLSSRAEAIRQLIEAGLLHVKEIKRGGSPGLH
jgi:hypothetical protein